MHAGNLLNLIKFENVLLRGAFVLRQMGVGDEPFEMFVYGVFLVWGSRW